MKWFLIMFVITAWACDLFAGDPYLSIQPEHKEIIQKWIGDQKIKPAVQSDNSNESCKEIMKSPYYKVQDFNGDGKSDFAVILTGTGKAYVGKLVIFNGPFKKVNDPIEPIGIFNVSDLDSSVLVTNEGSSFISFCRCPSTAFLDDNCFPVQWTKDGYQEFIRHYD